MTDAKYRILAVEPNAADLRLLCRALQDSGVVKELDKAATLTNAITIIDDHRPDIVILNLMLPPHREVSALLKFFQEAPGIPIVVIVPRKYGELAERAVLVGAQDYLYKEHLSSLLLARIIDYAITRFALKAEVKTYLSRLDSCENKNRHLQDLMIDLIHKMAQPLQVLGNTLEINTTNEENESLKLCRRMVGQISDLLKGFRRNCRNN